MKALQLTLEDLKILSKNKVDYLLTRFNHLNKENPGDVDILVKPKDFEKVIELLNRIGYQTFSHDQALGGRVKGAQKNLVKEDRIKVDLHQDFTWRATRYLDLEIIWKDTTAVRIDGVESPSPDPEIDMFIIIINLIFEKTYITKPDYDYMKDITDKVLDNKLLEEQSRKYGWHTTFVLFKKWFANIRKSNYPVFLPVWLVLFSYLEKMIHDKYVHIISFMYYVFFRSRYAIKQTLPYE